VRPIKIKTAYRKTAKRQDGFFVMYLFLSFGRPENLSTLQNNKLKIKNSIFPVLKNSIFICILFWNVD